MKKEKLINVILAIVLSFSLIVIVYAICSLNKDYTSSSIRIPTDDESITLYTNRTSSSSERQVLLDNILTKYSTENNMDISCTSLSALDFYIKLQTDFAVGDMPDIIASSFNSCIRHIYESGKIAALNGELDKDPAWLSSIESNALQAVTINGNYIGIPTEYEYIAVYINTTLFKKHGIAIPQNYSELKQAIRILNANGITPIAYGQQDTNMFLLQLIISSLGDYNGVSAPYKYNSSGSNCYISALSYMRELYELGAFPANSASLTYNDARSLFLSGSAAMIADSTSFANHIVVSSKQKEDYEGYEIISFPTMLPTTLKSSTDNAHLYTSAVPYYVGENTYYISTNAYSKKHRQVIPLLKMLCSQETVQQMHDNVGLIPAIKGVTPRSVQPSIQAKAYGLQYMIIGYTPSPAAVLEPYSWYTTLYGSVPQIMTHTLSEKDVWNSIENFSASVSERIQK